MSMRFMMFTSISPHCEEKNNNIMINISGIGVHIRIANSINVNNESINMLCICVFLENICICIYRVFPASYKGVPGGSTGDSKGAAQDQWVH